MRRKLAVIVCAALMTAMLGACGGSTGASTGQAEAPAETATEEAEPAAETATEEAEPAAETATEEAEPAAEAAPEAEAAEEVATEDTAAEINAGGNAFANGAILGAITPEGDVENSEFEKLAGLDPQEALGSAPAIENIEGLNGDVAASLNGKISLQGKTQEYSAFYLGENNGVMGFVVTFADSSDTLVNYVEVYDFDKSAGYTREGMMNLSADVVYPGFSDLSCSDWVIYDCGSVYRMMLALVELDDPDNVKEIMDYGFFTSSDYHYPQLLAASTLNNSLRSGYYQLSDEEIDQLQLVD